MKKVALLVALFFASVGAFAAQGNLYDGGGVVGTESVSQSGVAGGSETAVLGLAFTNAAQESGATGTAKLTVLPNSVKATQNSGTGTAGTSNSGALGGAVSGSVFEGGAVSGAGAAGTFRTIGFKLKP